MIKEIWSCMLPFGYR